MSENMKSLCEVLEAAVCASLAVKGIFWAMSHSSDGMCQSGPQTETPQTQQVPCAGG